MKIIAQFIENLKSLETNIYFINTKLEPLVINQYVPNNIKSLIDNEEIKELINSLNSNMQALTNLLTPIAIKAKKATNKRHSSKIQPYANFIIDEPPVVQDNSDKLVQLSFEDIILNKDIKPVNRRKKLSYKGTCPHCSAPNEYIYDNSKSKQFLCKVCDNTFSVHPHYYEEISHHCPHCSYKLYLHRERSNYDVLVCRNNNCSFYLKNKRLFKDNKADHLKTTSGSTKIRYSFRFFDFNLDAIKACKDFKIRSKIDLSKIRHSNFALGLVLTYYVNYGLSSRKTALIMREVHDIHISHQTVINYAEAVAVHTEHLNENYKYDLSDHLTLDETYIKVKGKTNYVFFASDTKNKIITSSRIFSNRDTKNAITTIYQSINKYKTFPQNLTLITDGNHIYNAAQVFFLMNDIKFDLHQVIGISNKDEVSRLYRPYKQAEERLNRTYKQNYYGTNGYGTLRNANVYMSLYVSFSTFLESIHRYNIKPLYKLKALKRKT